MKTYHSYESLLSSYLKILNILYPDKSKRSSIRIIDLGCQYGDYSFDFARQGFNVLGLEVREINYNVCKERLKCADGIIDFVQDDCWNIEKYGTFDVIFCSGLLYHLDKPSKYLELMSKVCKKVLILNTHFSMLQKKGKHVGPVSTNNEHLPGTWYKEFDPGTSFKDREVSNLSSWENDNSFWIQKEFLIQKIRDIGFDTVLEQYDGYTRDYIVEDYDNEQRSTFIGIKT